LEHKRHAVFTPILNGFQERKHLSSLEIDLETHIQDILNAIVYEELDDVVLIGHIYGAMVLLIEFLAR